MHKKSLLLSLFRASVAALLFTACSKPPTSELDATSNKKQTNIVFVMADDLGQPQMGCYGSTYYNTPNLDKFATQGVKFTNAYSAAAVCSPTRAALLTGKNPSRINITDFISGNPHTNYPLSQPDWQKVLPLEETTFAEILKENGYNTALFGKWHLSKKKTPPESLEHAPETQGFDESFVTYKPADYLPIKPWQTAENDAHNVDTLTNLSVDFIKRNKDTPFFLMLSHNSIHAPIMEKQRAIQRFEDKPETELANNNPILGAMVERIDSSFGQIYSTLEDLGLLENTLVIFYSDNGALLSDAAQTPFRKGKGWLYEGGIRVPLIMQWKNQIESNSINEAFVTSMDFFTTFLEATSSTQQNPTDGINILSLLEEGLATPERNLYWNYPHYHEGSGMPPACAIRSGDYKLIKWYEPYLLQQTNIYELYNLKNDIGESENLADSLPEKVKELDQLLETWKIEVNAQEPIINLEFKGK